ncbi:FRG domain-containing protein [Lactococcus lactis]|jgi:hypothetical protein|uniref:FRG domain-containing protein n=1 Tax=Lactococcus TaxID=1357 RepID=UPI00288EF7D9|nr:FRG domain-containing protein [Lactococcus lactis]MDT2872322.1 FRG domain-containing protein [Lactococcus lactis]MDT2876730.1 FRG domain-containing protein [Lactococcus lactis]MDT2895793.1 FRG domain-containing protein [Lactococcus lactis]MDT2918564.1 FRG domain-containing protein [Lactococcus lactis]
MKKFEISNLVDFMTILQEISLDNRRFYFRGESLKHEKPLLASGYRNTQFPKELRIIRKDYFREVGYSLDKDSRENFMAYSQHHGLPTELLDVTENPIVALYFACEANFDSDGMLYAIENDGFIADPLTSKLYDKEMDIESIQEQMEQAGAFFQESGGKSIKFQDTSFYKEMYSTFYSILTLENINRENPHLNSKLKICRYILEAHYKGVMETIIHDSSNIHKNKENIVELMNLLDKYSDVSGKEELENFYSEFKILKFVKDVEISPDVNTGNPYQARINELDCKPLMLLFVMAYEIRDDKFPPFPKIIYKPSIIFDRLKNQQGAFIYQMSTYKSSPLTPSSKPFYRKVVKNVIQKIDFEYEVVIKNKKQILKELDIIGINKKFIYPDSDNIAQYIREKYNI